MAEVEMTDATSPAKNGDHNKDLNTKLSPLTEDNNEITRKVYIFAFCAALNSCNLGYDIGVNTGAAQLLQEDMDLSNHEIEVFLGSLNLFSIFGAACAYSISDCFGRRRAFLVAAITFIIGIVIICTAQDFKILIFGRVFLGLGVGFGLAVDPVYISEISPKKHRGRLVTWSEFALNFGIVLGFSSGLVFSHLPDEQAWRHMFGLGAIMPSILIILVIFVMPESPRWLVAKERHDEAANILRQIYPEGFQIELVLRDIQESLEKEAQAYNAVGWEAIFCPTPAVRRMLLVGVGTAVAQQAVGIDAIQYYLVYIVQEAGINDRESQTWILIFLGLLKLIVISIAGFLFDTTGRRPLMFISLICMTVALLIQAFNFLTVANDTFTIISLSIYFIFFSLGIGPGAWLIPSEVFSNLIRAKAMSLSTFSNRIVSTIMASSVLSVAANISWSGFFLLLAFVCLFVGIFLYIYLPETKGKSLEEMTVYFADITGDQTILQLEEEYRAKRHVEMSDQDHSKTESSGTMT